MVSSVDLSLADCLLSAIRDPNWRARFLNFEQFFSPNLYAQSLSRSLSPTPSGNAGKHLWRGFSCWTKFTKCSSINGALTVMPWSPITRSSLAKFLDGKRIQSRFISSNRRSRSGVLRLNALRCLEYPPKSSSAPEPIRITRHGLQYVSPLSLPMPLDAK